MSLQEERPRICVLHIATGLDAGGAERVLERLIESMDDQRFENRVISLTSFGNVAEALEEKGFHVQALEMPRRFPTLPSLMKLGRAIREADADIIQTWMYHADILGGVMGRLVSSTPVLWNLRQTTLDHLVTRRSLLLTTRAGAWLSRWIPFTIVCGSHAARLVHEEVGYSIENTQVIPNGHDNTVYRPDPTARQRLLTELGLDEGSRLIGLPARFHPQKDHATFLKAVSSLQKERHDVEFILFGENIDQDNDELAALISENGICDGIHLMGRMAKMEDYYPALDSVVLSSSFGEGAPNVLGEAMLCGVPCIATRIGDCERIVGDTGMIIEPGDPAALAKAIQSMLDMPAKERTALGQRARQRIEVRFGLADMVQRYEDLYQRVASQQMDNKALRGKNTVSA